MKKVILLFFVLILSNLTYAYHFEDNGFYYFLMSENPATVEVTLGENAYSGSVNIPSSVNYYGKTYSVVSIGGGAFAGCTALTSVAIPNTVTEIGNNAFSGCTALTSVAIPNTVTEIGSEAFSGCTSLSSVTLSNALKSINAYAFNGCSSLLSISIPNSVTTINLAAFSGCTSLSTIDIPISVTSIGETAFDNTPWFNSKPDGAIYINSILYRYKGTMPLNSKIVIAGGVVSISNQAFMGYKNMTEISIPNSVTIIGDNAFENCTGLTNLSLPNSVKRIGSIAFRGCTALTTLNIPNSVTDIGVGAFFLTSWYNSQPNGLIYINKVAWVYKGSMPQNTQISIMEGSIAISECAFKNCSNLTSIVIPNSVENIGSGAFSYCTGLNSLTLPSNITNIGTETFFVCSGLINISIPNSVISIGDKAFCGCKSLINISIPNSVISIGSSAFNSCSSFINISIPNSVISIGSSAFYGCTRLKSIELPSNLENIDDYAFYNTGLTSIIIPIAVRYIGVHAFSGTSIKSITIPSNVVKIGASAFSGCTQLEYIDIPGSVITNFVNDTYDVNCDIIKGCLNLNTIKAPADVFSSLNSQKLTNLKINGGVLSQVAVKNIQGSYQSVKKIDLTGILNTELFDESFSGFYNLDTIILPSNLSKVPYKCVAGCLRLKQITVPSKVSELEMSSFENCRSLKSIVFEGNSQLKKIDNWAFYACHSLDSINIPNGVQTIGDGAFWGCNYLKLLTIPSSVASIGENGFDGCKSLSSIRINAISPPSVEDYTFNEVDKSIPLIVPTGSLNSYRNASGWKDFIKIIGMSIDSVNPEDPEYSITVINGKVTLTNILGKKVALYDLSGRNIFQKSISQDSEVITVGIQGLYLLRVGNQSAKVMVQ